MPLFSIVTVTLNPPQEDLQRTLESVLEQEFEDWELIVKDGGSRERALDGVPEDERIRVVTEEDSGIFDAMNQSLQYARGRFICFLNAGDILMNTSVLDLVAKGAREHPDVEFLYGDVSKPQSRSGFERYPRRLSRFYLFSHMICHQVWFVRRGYYQKIGGYETDFLTGSDYRFLLRMILRDQIEYAHVPAVLASYQGGGISQEPAHVQRAAKWVDELRHDLFGRTEYSIYWLINETKIYLKRAIYDRGGWRIWRKVQEWKGGGNGE